MPAWVEGVQRVGAVGGGIWITTRRAGLLPVSLAFSFLIECLERIERGVAGLLKLELAVGVLGEGGEEGCWLRVRLNPESRRWSS